jgi:hypothetical protein
MSPVTISNAARKRMQRYLRSMLAHRVSPADAIAVWSSGTGTLALGLDGYKALSAIVHDLRRDVALRTYPPNYLRSVIAHSAISASWNETAIVQVVVSTLQSDFGQQRAFVPLWGLHIEPSILLDFGPYKLRTLGETGFVDEILKPLQQIREELGPDQVASDTTAITKDYIHIPQIPALIVDYTGSSEGAEDFVAPIVERVAEVLQFLVARSLRNGRNDAKIIDHRGAYFGRFESIMPVVSRDLDRSVPTKLDSPNLRGNPWGPTLTMADVDHFRSIGALDWLAAIPEGPRGRDDVTDMLLRAIQLFADGERAVSLRQAMIAYVGVCDTLFGREGAAERYTCTGMALSLDGDFRSGYKAAKSLYESRSSAVHRGLTPDGVGPARQIAYRSLEYVMKNKGWLSSKKAIRAWLEPHVPRKGSLFAVAVQSLGRRITRSFG